MTEKSTTIKNRAGIHARPATLIVKEASKFKSNVYIEKNSEKINAKSILNILTLGGTYNSEIKVIAEGDDELEAVEALINLIDNKFEE
ncbi:HPr family phosphocarrier protein [Thiospirochaeta perfilievii]|uniref:HPr family phosphocarrier protein n=1 Tax=Thiospirochaeta perfilievii TaxID=252967 RepID=A0A5C1QF55_9SPIO|nr:HPr family phosphocarrier protein [Thiospirochaeta perfilievii]QEN04812.1 HPr family phosphocarrier protein [Thiospirochaeta perfilievii]